MRGQMRIDKEKPMVREFQADPSGASVDHWRKATSHAHAAFVAHSASGQTGRYKVLVDAYA